MSGKPGQSTGAMPETEPFLPELSVETAEDQVQGRIPHTEVLGKTRTSSIYTLLAKVQFRWTGRAIRTSRSDSENQSSLLSQVS